jgi:WD40 repeat protein
VKAIFRAVLPDSAASVSFSPSGDVLGVATFAGPVIFLRTGSGETAWTTAGHAGGALAVAFSPRAPLVATGGQDGRVMLFELGEGQAIADGDGGGPWVSHLAWSTDGEVLASAAGRSVRFFDRRGQLLAAVDDHVSTVSNLAYVPALNGWMSASYGGVRVFAQGSLSLAYELTFRTSVLEATVSADGRYVAAGTQDPIVRVWDRNDDFEVINLEGYPSKVTALAFAPRGMWLATGSGTGALVLWDFSRGTPGAPSFERRLHTKRVTAVAFAKTALLTASIDGRALVLGAAERDVIVLQEAATGAPIHLLRLSPAGDTFVVAGVDGTLSLFPLDA